MPELPEVETVRRTLKNFVLNHQIQSVDVYYPPIINGNVEIFKETLTKQHIVDIARRGKYLIFILDDVALVSHLRMEGKYFYESTSTPLEKHSHLVFHLDQEMDLRYHDTRKFGRLELVSKDHYMDMPPLDKLGKEPYDLTAIDLKNKLIHCHQPIKQALLDQTKIAGLGNIYVCEVLYRAGIHPLTKACDLTKSKLQTIIDVSCEVLDEAVIQGGTTISSFSSQGIHGLFSQQLDVYGRQNEACHHCGHPIEKITIQGRGTYYCPCCQKIIKKRRKRI